MKPGDNLDGRYTVVARIGGGRFSDVFKGVVLDESTDGVAIKVLKDHIDNPQFAEAFNREAVALKTLSHENIVQIIDTGTTPDRYPYLVTELCGKPITPLQQDFDRGATGLALALLKAVQHAHASNVIHRDIKPQHLLRGTVEGRESIKLIDFGIAKIRRYVGEGYTLAGLYTPGYACKEQIEGVDARPQFDLYAIAASLYWYITGNDPGPGVGLPELLDGSTPQLLRSRLREFLVQLARAGETGLTAGVALRQLQQLSEQWVSAEDTYLVLSNTAMTRLTSLLGLEPHQQMDTLAVLRDDLDPFEDRYPSLVGQLTWY
jgi:serine/threonine protein kinase